MRAGSCCVLRGAGEEAERGAWGRRGSRGTDAKPARPSHLTPGAAAAEGS